MKTTTRIRLMGRSATESWQVGIADVPSYQGLPRVVRWRGRIFVFESYPADGSGDAAFYETAALVLSDDEVRIPKIGGAP